jgi:two-component system response regulator
MNDSPILLVEDNPDDVMLTLRAFKKNNITNELIVAGDGEQALEYLLPADDRQPRRDRLQPAIVLLDINLPKVSGLEVLRRLRADERTEALPVIVLTTSNEERDMVESYRLGANSYVRKPVVFSDFLDAARILGLYWLLVNENLPDRHTGR